MAPAVEAPSASSVSAGPSVITAETETDSANSLPAENLISSFDVSVSTENDLGSGVDTMKPAARVAAAPTATSAPAPVNPIAAPVVTPSSYASSSNGTVVSNNGVSAGSGAGNSNNSNIIAPTAVAASTPTSNGAQRTSPVPFSGHSSHSSQGVSSSQNGAAASDGPPPGKTLRGGRKSDSRSTSPMVNATTTPPPASSENVPANMSNGIALQQAASTVLAQENTDQAQ
jgi:hypothetical protein